MPQATDEQRDLMYAMFGDRIGEAGPMTYLTDRGYYEKAGWWFKPSKEHIVTGPEYDCLNFLCDEWDFAYDFTGDI